MVLAKQKILYVGYGFEDGQAPHNGMAGLWLAMNGIDVQYICLSGSEPPKWLDRVENLNYRRCVSRGLLGKLRFFYEILVAIFREKPELLYIQGAQQAAVIAPMFALLPRSLRVLYHTQDFKPVDNVFYRAGEKFVAKRANLSICNEVNRSRCMWLLYGLPRVPETIRTALPKEWPLPLRSNQPEYLMCNVGFTNSKMPENPIYIAGGGPYKDRRKSSELLNALAILPKNYILVFTGMSPDEENYRRCMKLARDLAVEDRVIALPSLPYSDLQDLFSYCHVGMLLYCDSDIANFYQGPGRLTEYLRAGLPIVASNYPGLELTTLKHDLGSVCDSDSPDDIANAVLRLDLENALKVNERRVRLQQLSLSVFCYEQDAIQVFSSLFRLDDNLVSKSMEAVFPKLQARI